MVSRTVNQNHYPHILGCRVEWLHQKEQKWTEKKQWKTLIGIFLSVIIDNVSQSIDILSVNIVFEAGQGLVKFICCIQVNPGHQNQPSHGQTNSGKHTNIAPYFSILVGVVHDLAGQDPPENQRNNLEFKIQKINQNSTCYERLILALAEFKQPRQGSVVYLSKCSLLVTQNVNNKTNRMNTFRLKNIVKRNRRLAVKIRLGVEKMFTQPGHVNS